MDNGADEREDGVVTWVIKNLGREREREREREKGRIRWV